MRVSLMPSGRQPVLGALAVLVAVTVWGGVAVIAKIVDGIDGTVLGFHRLWIGALVTVAIFMARGGRLSWALLRDCVPGGVAFGLDILLFFSALRHTTVANATVIGALQPALLLLVVGRLFGERVTAALVGWTAVAIAGVALVMYGSAGTPAWSLWGDILAIGALFAWTGYFIASKQARRDRGALEYLAGLLVVATGVAAPVAVLLGGQFSPEHGADWAWIAVLAVGSGGFGHLLINWAHDHVDLSVMSVLTLAVPICAAASAAIFLDEPIVAAQVVGITIVVVALGVVVLRTTREAVDIAAIDTSEPSRGAALHS
jgi:drug/metabolite transporter (DMT)-like permease